MKAKNHIVSGYTDTDLSLTLSPSMSIGLRETERGGKASEFRERKGEEEEEWERKKGGKVGENSKVGSAAAESDKPEAAADMGK